MNGRHTVSREDRVELREDEQREREALDQKTRDAHREASVRRRRSCELMRHGHSNAEHRMMNSKQIKPTAVSHELVTSAMTHPNQIFE